MASFMAATRICERTRSLEGVLRLALSVLGASASETVKIGDDVIGDVGGAQRAGLRGVLVRTGKFRPADLEGHVRPDGVLDSLASLPERLAGLFDRR